LRNKEIGFIFQQFNLLAKTSAVEQVELPLIYAKVAEQERKEKSCCYVKKLGLGDRFIKQAWRVIWWSAAASGYCSCPS
jgi:putative ABC transport system ATP-binding protein